MTKTAATLDAEITAALVPGTPAVNAPLFRYQRVVPARDGTRYRWIGRCKRCGATHALEGQGGAGVTSKGDSIAIVIANDGRIFNVGDLGTNPYKVTIRCGDHWCNLARVVEGTKGSKHECGARCTNATGPNCDCKCKGRNHGSNC